MAVHRATAAAPGEAGGEDDWYSNFNDLSASLDTSPGKKAESGVIPRKTLRTIAEPRTPRTRNASAESDGVRHFANVTSAKLEHQIKNHQRRLQELERQVAQYEADAASEESSPHARMHIIQLRSETALRERVLELRRNKAAGTEPLDTVRTQRPRRFGAGHPAITSLASVSIEELRERRRKAHAILQRKSVTADDASSKSPRKTAFVRPAASTLQSLRDKVTLYERAIELREQETADSVTEKGEDPLHSGMTALAQKLKRELNPVREDEQVASTSKSAQRDAAEESDPLVDAKVKASRRSSAVQRPGEKPSLPDKQTSEPNATQLAAVIASLQSELRKEYGNERRSEAHAPSSSTLGVRQAELESDMVKEGSEPAELTENGAMEQSQGARDLNKAEVDDEPSAPRRMRMPVFSVSQDEDYISLPTRSTEPTIAEKVRLARDTPKWGGFVSDTKKRPSTTSKRRAQRLDEGQTPDTPSQDDVAALFADSPADLAELRATATMAKGISSPKPAQGSFSKSRTLESLKSNLHLAISKQRNAASRKEQVPQSERDKAVAQNIEDYQRSAEPINPETKSTVLSDASASLAQLHRMSATTSNESTPVTPKTKKPEPTKDKAGKNESEQPVTKRGRRSRRNLLQEKKQSTVRSASKTAKDTSPSVNDNGENEHKPLWQVMQESAASSASEEASSAAEPDVPMERSDGPPPAVDAIRAADLHIEPLDIPQPPVPALEYGLDKVLFNPGVYQLQDPTSRVYNFDPYLQQIMPAMEFDFNALKEYKTSSEDQALSAIAKEHQKKYIGSTSSMTSTLAHFHYLISNWRSLNLEMLSRGFTNHADEFTKINRAPNAIFLRWKPASKTYAIDADKEYDGANVLMMLGKSMEKLMTLPKTEFERYRKSDPREVPDEMRDEPEAFQYTTMGDFLMRSQLDAYDPRLPGTGMFDLKTRAVLSVRMDAEDFEPMVGYELHTLQGRWNSYEREYYDMMRSTMLKYMLQARMGRMQGIFAAYHNIQRIFGFQYIPIMEMDRAIHGQIDPALGDQEFKVSLELLNKVLDKATAQFPEQSLRVHFETTRQNDGSDGTVPVMWVFAEPMAEKDIKRIQNQSKEKVREFEKNVMGIADSDASTRSQKPAAEASEAEDQAPTEYPPCTPEPETDEPETTEPGPEEDSVPTTYPPVTPQPPSSSTSNPDFSTSSSAADSDFLSSLTSSTSTSSSTSSSPSTSGSSSTSNTPLSPLFVASIMVKSKVNGDHVSRPARLTRDDDWTVEYMVNEYQADEAAWARYVATKARRKEAFSKERDDDEDMGDRKKGGDGFIKFLREMAKKGREERREMDDAERGVDRKFAWTTGAWDDRGVGAEPVATPQKTEAEVQDLEGYMGWLYAERGRKA